MMQYILVALTKPNRYHPPTIDPPEHGIDYVTLCHKIEDEFESDVKAAIIVEYDSHFELTNGTKVDIEVNTTPQAWERVHA